VGMSGVRAAILAAAVVLGIFGLAKAFPDSGGPTFVAHPSTSTSPSPSTTHTTPPKSLPTKKSPSPRTTGVKVQVLNGSGGVGLAALTSDTIRNANLGYTVLDAANSARTATTVVYYQPGFKGSAEYLQSKLFQDATVQAATSSASQADLTVVLGTDYAATAAATP
jgi:hypothetical protein